MKTLKHEELYRSADLMAKMANLDIVMCGIGAIGSNLVENLVRQGFKKITAIDFDRIEEHNRHTQIWYARDVGQLKATMLKNRIFDIMNIPIEVIPKKLEEANSKKLLNTQGVVIDGFDNVPSRKFLTEYCSMYKTDCLHIGLFKDYAEIIWNERYRVPDDTKNIDVCEYPLARNIILLAVAVATEILITYLEKKEKQNCIITLKDLKITRI